MFDLLTQILLIVGGIAKKYSRYIISFGILESIAKFK